MKYLTRTIASLPLHLTDLIGKITILISFVIGSAIYWTSISMFALFIWVLLLVVTFFWTIVELITNKVSSLFAPVQSYSKNYAKNSK
jgi:hypothetical protein